MLSNFNVAGLTSEELEHLITERCAAFGTVKRVAVCDSLAIVPYKLAFIAMATPAELAKVIKEVGAISIGDAAVIRLDLKPAARPRKSGDAALIGVAAIAGCAALFGLYTLAQMRMADVTFVQVFSKLALGQSRKQVEAIAMAANLGAAPQSPAGKPNAAAFSGACCGVPMTGARYELLAGYDSDDRLASARLLKSPDKSCSILFEIPSLADKTYPYGCPANARNP